MILGDFGNLDAPELCMTHFLIEDYFALNTHQNEKLCPYVFANVFESGAICFGDFFDRCPRDLRQAWNYYWETPFNRENSGYYEYHRDRCIGISSHSQAGHREGKCICACCVEICNCPCYCVQSHLFEQYLKECPSREFSFEENPQIIGKDSVILEVLSSQLIVIPKEIGTRLGLKGTKYPDIFLFVQREDETNYHCEVDQQPIIIPKALVQNGTAKTT